MERATPESQPVPASAAPSVLVVGDDPISGELVEALRGLGMEANSVLTAEGVLAVVEEAPDLVILAGGARRSASRLLEPLTDHPGAAPVPVVLLGDTTEVGARARDNAFTAGVVGRMQRDLGSDLIAREVQRIVDELPERPGEARGVVAEATLDELVDLLSSELQSGILSVNGEREAHIVLRAGKPVAEGIDAFVERVRPMLEEGGEAQYAFHAHPSGRIDSVPPASMRPTSPRRVIASLRDRRLLVMHSERETAERWATALRRLGAEVQCLCDDGDLEPARNFDAEVLIVEPSALEGRRRERMETIQRDERLRWAATLIAPQDAVEHPEREELYLDDLADKVVQLCAPHDELLRRAALNEPFETRLELVGPAQLLRALGGSGRAVAVHVQHPNAMIEVNLSGGRVLEARGLRRDRGTERVEGQHALSLLLSLRRGRVRVQPSPGFVRPQAPEPLSLHPKRFIRPSPLPSIGPGPLVSSIPPPPLLPSGAGTPGPARAARPMLGVTLTAMALAILSLVAYVVGL